MSTLTLYFTFFVVLISTTFTYGQTWTHDFETAGGYTGSIAECSDGTFDYFIRTNGGDISDTPNSGVQGSFYFAAQDVDAATCPAGGTTETIDFDDIDISSCTGLFFEVLLAEPSNFNGWDDDEYVHFYYDIDNSGSWSNLLWIENDGGGINGPTLIDTDFDGTGDGTTLTFDMVNFTAAIAGTGSLIDIRVEFRLTDGGANICLDNLRIFGAGCGVVPATITTGAITGAPFDVDCLVPTTDNGSVSFTSVGTFNVGNTFTVELSDETGSFAAPTSIGTLTGATAEGVNPGTSIPFIIPSGVDTGTGTYLIRIVSDNPSATGSSSAAFTINQNGNCTPPLPASEGLIINEWSNGDSGSREYYEFVVAGQCGDIVDVRGYILDDNNGTFSTTFPSSSGIAAGHLRLTNDAQWAAIPVGSLIVIYNNDSPADNNLSLPADDLTDANNDSLYVIPHDNTTYFQVEATIPNNSTPDSTYTPSTYAGSSWNALGLRNAGDAIQVRSPNGDYWHGISYGGAEISGGPNNMKISTSGMGGNCGWFNSGDIFDASNWSTGVVAGNETPGLPNNAANLAWLQLMRSPSTPTCPVTILPVELSNFDGHKTEDGNLLFWRTEVEINSDYFLLESSNDGKKWQVVNTQSGGGDSQNPINYSFVDDRFSPTINYYRLTQFDFDGKSERFNKTVVIDNSIDPNVYLVKIINVLGQEITEGTAGVQIHVYSDGTSEKIFKH